MATVLVLAGLVLILVAPLLRGLLDRQASDRLAIGGLSLQPLSIAVEIWVERRFGPMSFVALAILGWALFTFIVLQSRLARLRPPPAANPVEHCVSKLTRGQDTYVPALPAQSVDRIGVFSGLRYRFICKPTDSSLYEYLWSVAWDYYVIWTSAYEVFQERTITIACETKDGRCKIAKPVSVVGPKEEKDRSLTGEIGEEIEYADDTLTIVVAMGVALGASDVTVTPKASKAGVGATVTIKFKNASRESPDCDMGTYVWKCIPVEGASTGSSSTGSSTGATGAGTGTTPSGTGTGTGGTTPARKTCANTYPDALDCVDDLDSDFIYDTYEELIEAVEAAAGEKITKVETEDQDDRGPCPGAGKHYNFYGASGEFHGSGFCCNCCEDLEDGPHLTQKYKYNG